MKPAASRPFRLSMHRFRAATACSSFAPVCSRITLCSAFDASASAEEEAFAEGGCGEAPTLAGLDCLSGTSLVGLVPGDGSGVLVGLDTEDASVGPFVDSVSCFVAAFPFATPVGGKGCRRPDERVSCCFLAASATDLLFVASAMTFSASCLFFFAASASRCFCFLSSAAVVAPTAFLGSDITTFLVPSPVFTSSCFDFLADFIASLCCFEVPDAVDLGVGFSGAGRGPGAVLGRTLPFDPGWTVWW